MIKTYNNFLFEKLLFSEKPGFFTSKEAIEVFLAFQEIENYTIHDDLTIDVHQEVTIKAPKNSNNDNMPYLRVKFNKVEGSFNCEYLGLYSLEGCPKHVEKDFWCSYNNIYSLEGCPTYVGQEFKSNQCLLVCIDIEDWDGIKEKYVNVNNNPIITLNNVPDDFEILANSYNEIFKKLENPIAKREKLEKYYKTISNSNFYNTSKLSLETWKDIIKKTDPKLYDSMYNSPVLDKAYNSGFFD